jgi:hypothetical protein
MMLDSMEYIENTSNEGQVRDGWYFGGGMFVAAKRLDKWVRFPCEEITIISYAS